MKPNSFNVDWELAILVGGSVFLISLIIVATLIRDLWPKASVQRPANLVASTNAAWVSGDSEPFTFTLGTNTFSGWMIIYQTSKSSKVEVESK